MWLVFKIYKEISEELCNMICTRRVHRRNETCNIEKGQLKEFLDEKDDLKDEFSGSQKF